MNADFEATLSRKRFSRYLEWAKGSRNRAFELYALNTELSEALYTPLQTLEVTLRNRIHAVLVEKRGEHWFDGDFLRANTQRIELEKAYYYLEHKGKSHERGRKTPNSVVAALNLGCWTLTLQRNGKPHERRGEVSDPDRVVAALSFGFWTTMLQSKYDDLWTETLHRIACSENGGNLARKKLYDPLKTIRRLRNRIAHHEPILRWNLPEHHDNIMQVTRWLSPAAAEWCERNSRFQEVLPAERIILHEDSRS